ncbi:MAG: 50S ribosomal protein L6 [Tissierellia bacterium]|nr:50S ribosomal protein L6 [Tissierellia bacterium]
MSRIGLKPIEIPSGVTIDIKGNDVVVKGPKGELTLTKVPEMKLEMEDGVLNVVRPNETKRMKSLHGLTRSLIQNMVTGVTEGFKKSLTIVGTGYRAQMSGAKLGLTLGFSHPLEVEIPKGLTVEVPAQDTIIVSGSDKQQVGQFAAKIRGYRPPEPYLGKGIRYSDETVRRKVGKTGK